MVRKYFCKSILTFHPKEREILVYINSRKDNEIITQTKVADALNEKITTVNYHFKKLRKKGLIDEKNKLTIRCKKILRYFMRRDKTFSRKLRAHNIQVVFKLLRVPKDFSKIKNIMFTPFTNGRYKGLKTELCGCKVLFYNSRRVVVSFPDVYANNNEEIIATINDCASQLIEVLEMEFDGLKVDSYKPAKYKSMHIAILDSIIAKQFILKNKGCFSNGRVAIDKSHGRYELEAESVDTVFEDIEFLVKYEDLVAEIMLLKNIIKKLEVKKDG